MPKRKVADRAVELVELAGPSGSIELELELAPGTSSGFAGVVRAGRKWQARINMKGIGWRCIGTFESPRDAAVQRALMIDNDDAPPTPPPRAPRTAAVQSRGQLPPPPAPMLCVTARAVSMRDVPLGLPVVFACALP